MIDNNYNVYTKILDSISCNCFVHTGNISKPTAGGHTFNDSTGKINGSSDNTPNKEGQGS